MRKYIGNILGRLRGRVIYRIFIPFFLTIVLGVSIALPYGMSTTSRIMEDHADSQVLSAADVVSNIIRRDLDKLLTFCELKIYSTAIQEAINERDTTKLRQLIIPVKARSRVDSVVIFDREGKEIIRFDERQILGDNLTDLKIVRNGLNGMRYQDVVITPSRLILCAIAPNETAGVSGGMNGAMMVGQVVSDAMVREIRDTIGTDLLISNPEGMVMASSLGDRPYLLKLLDIGKQAATLGRGEKYILNTIFNGRTPYRTADELFSIHQEPRAIISVIADISGIYSTKRNVTTVMITLMFGGLAAAVFFSLGIAQSISRPIQNLVKATELMASGDFYQRITDVPPDEIGRLSGSFNTMAERLRRDIAEIQEARNKAQIYSHEMEEINRELKKARNELIQASKLVAMGQLGAGIAHELNQPLLAIGLFAEQSLRHLEKGTQEYKNVERIINQTNRMSQIINEIRLFARQSLLEPREVDVNEPLKKALALIDRQMADANIQVEVDLSPDLPKVLADDNQLQQVFLNLITNARDAIMPKGMGKLSIRTSPVCNGQFAAIDFTDDGIGIPAEIINDIFLPFFTTKRETKGLGLGLSISYGIIERHSGTIKVWSTPGKETTFRILLPTVLAKHCWEEVDCAVCRPGGNRESCPIYTKDQGYYCWAYFERSGDEDQVSVTCRKCPLYKTRHTLITQER